MTTNSYSYSTFALGRLMSVQEGNKSPTKFDYYEPSGLVHDIYSPLPGTTGGTATIATTYTYDALGNVTSVQGPGNGTVASITKKFNYTDDSGDTVHNIPALTGQTAAAGQPLTAQDNLGKFTHFRYDAQGHLVTTYDALGNRTDYGYTEPGADFPAGRAGTKRYSACDRSDWQRAGAGAVRLSVPRRAACLNNNG